MELINALKMEHTTKQNRCSRSTVSMLLYHSTRISQRHQRCHMLESHWIWQNCTVKCSLTGVYWCGKPDTANFTTVVNCEVMWSWRYSSTYS